jgi:sulfatase-like protein
MGLSISPAASHAIKRQFKDFLVCFSLANLCFMRRWYDLEHLKERSMDYYRTAPASATLLWATLICAFLLTAVFWLAWKWVDRDPTPFKMKLAQCGFLVAFMFPLESVREYWNQQAGRMDMLSSVALWSMEAVLAAGVALVMLGNLRILRAARRVALALTLLFPALMIDFALGSINVEPASAYLPKPALPLLPPRPGPPKRVVWILFDELDQRLVFDLHKPEVPMPEMDRLRAESLTASQAMQTAAWTTQALPSLLSGVIYSGVRLEGADELRVTLPDDPKTMLWRDVPNVFKKARALGVNAALVGWHHPYCRVFGDSLVRCMDVVSGHPTPALIRETASDEEGLLRTVRSLFELQLAGVKEIFSTARAPVTETIRDVYVQRRHQEQYFRIRDRALTDIADPRLDFVFVHMPAPHPFGLYDRARRDFTLNPLLGYADNLALVDRTWGEMRWALEQAGLWDWTSIVITADHGLRPDVWRGHIGWTDELERLTGGRQSERVPLIVKIAGESDAAAYDRPFSNVVCGDLSLGILSGEIRSVEDVARFLDGRAPVERTSR